MMPDYKIEKGIGIPPNRTATRYAGLSDVIKTMEVGDSIALPQITKYNPAANIQAAARKAGVRITIRRDGKTVRFWRVA